MQQHLRENKTMPLHFSRNIYCHICWTNLDICGQDQTHAGCVQQTMSAKYPGHLVERSRQQRGIVRKNESRQSAQYSRQETKMDSLVMSYVFHQQDQSVQQYSGRQKVGKEEEADLGRHGRTRYVMTYKRWMSAGRRPSLLLVTARSGVRSSPSVPAGTGGPKSECHKPNHSTMLVKIGIATCGQTDIWSCLVLPNYILLAKR